MDNNLNNNSNDNSINGTNTNPNDIPTNNVQGISAQVPNNGMPNQNSDTISSNTQASINNENVSNYNGLTLGVNNTVNNETNNTGSQSDTFNLESETIKTQDIGIQVDSTLNSVTPQNAGVNSTNTINNSMSENMNQNVANTNGNTIPSGDIFQVTENNNLNQQNVTFNNQSNISNFSQQPNNTNTSNVFNLNNESSKVQETGIPVSNTIDTVNNNTSFVASDNSNQNNTFNNNMGSNVFQSTPNNSTNPSQTNKVNPFGIDTTALNKTATIIPNAEQQNSSNNIGVAPINIASNDNANYNQNNNNMGNQNQINNIQNNPNENNNMFNEDEELLREFVGKNYDKITKNPFNFGGFFFTTLYMLYRKMFLLSIIFFLLNIVILNYVKIVPDIVINLLFGLFVNKIYLYHAKNKVNKIKQKNSQRSQIEIKNICSKKGGTSIPQVFLGGIVHLTIGFTILFMLIIFDLGGELVKFINSGGLKDFINEIKNSGSVTEDIPENLPLVKIENANLSGYSCANDGCTFDVTIDDKTEAYKYKGENIALLKDLSDYSEYININLYYVVNGEDKIITKYDIFIKSTNEDISSVKNEEELRDKIGLYSEGKHTDSFKLKKIGTIGAGVSDTKSYTYIDYTLVNEKNNEYEMRYIYSTGEQPKELTEGNNYTVTFTVSKGTFDYEYAIESIN